MEKFLNERSIRHSSQVKLAGRSGLDHLFDFVIPSSSDAPERVLQVVNSPRRDRAESLMFAVNDTRISRSAVQPEILEAFQKYEITATKWSLRDDIAPVLAA